MKLWLLGDAWLSLGAAICYYVLFVKSDPLAADSEHTHMAKLLFRNQHTSKPVVIFFAVTVTCMLVISGPFAAITKYRKAVVNFLLNDP